MESLDKFFKSKYLYFIARFIVGGTFIYASMDKIANPNEFAVIVANYNILPHKIVNTFAFILPLFELIFGIFLVIGLFIKTIALAFSVILFAFIIAIVFLSINGSLENCGCFSTSSEAVKQSPFLLIGRNLLLIIICIYVFLHNKASATTDLRIHP